MLYFAPNPTNIFEHLEWLLTGLMHAVAQRSRDCWVVWRIAGALTRRIQRDRNRVMALIAHIRAGKGLLPGRVRKPGAERREDPKAEARRRKRAEIWQGIRFCYAWLCPLVPMDAATMGSHLNVVLQDPEFRRVMAQDPWIVALLRPFVKMLAGDARLLEVKPEDFAPVAPVIAEPVVDVVDAAPVALDVVPGRLSFFKGS